MQIKVRTLSELKKLAAAMRQAIGDNGAVLALRGELGAGKTTFAKFFLGSAGIKNKITSPTFVLLNRYLKAGRHYYHLDLYRIKDFKEAAALGIKEAWSSGKNILLIEWANKIQRHLPQQTIELRFTVSGKERTVKILNLPPKMAKMISKLVKAH